MKAPSTELNKLALLLERNKFEHGLKVARSLLREYPYCGKTWEYCGQFYHQLNLLRLSQCALEVATTLIPLSVASQIALADCYIDSDHPEIAIQIYQHLIETKSLSGEVLLNISRCLETLEAYELAKWALVKSEHFDTGSATNHFQLAQHMSNSGYPCRMIETELKKAFRLEPENMDYRIGLACFLHCCHRDDEAYEYVDSLNPQLLGKMSCKCCLEKLVSVFSSANDSERLAISQARLSQISAKA